MLEALAADRSHIAALECQILNLERSLAALRADKQVAQRRLDSYKYPVLTLPNEIVSEIFIRSLPIYPLCPPLTGILSPTNLTHICRKWREIALATPGLWRAIVLPRAAALDQGVRALDVLRRSGGLPLSIQIRSDTHNGDGLRVLTAVASHCARWEYVKLALTRFSIIRGPMSLLRHLDLTLHDKLIPPVAVASGEMPLLRTVILNFTAARSVTLPWAQLTSLTLTKVYMEECVPLLRQTSNLVHCELQLFASFFTDRVDVGLPCLEELTLKDADVEGYTLIMPRPVNHIQSFIAPALCRLDVPEGYLGHSPIDSLTSFVSKSGCTLRHVRIQRSERRSDLGTDAYRTAFPSIHFVFGDLEL